jgi:hypothetical protein
MNTPRLRRIERVVLLASFVFSLAIGLVWFRSLLVFDQVQYTPPIPLDGTSASAEWEFSSNSGALQITRFKAVAPVASTNAPVELIEVYHKAPGWSLNTATGMVSGDILTTFLHGFRLFGWGREGDPEIGTTMGIRFPYAVPFMLPLIPAGIIWFRWKRRKQASRRGFPVEPKV